MKLVLVVSTFFVAFLGESFLWRFDFFSKGLGVPFIFLILFYWLWHSYDAERIWIAFGTSLILESISIFPPSAYIAGIFFFTGIIVFVKSILRHTESLVMEGLASGFFLFFFSLFLYTYAYADIRFRGGDALFLFPLFYFLLWAVLWGFVYYGIITVIRRYFI